MKPSRLRAWIRRYGDWGHLLAGLYLGGVYLRTNRRALLAAYSVFALMAVVGTWFWWAQTRPTTAVRTPLHVRHDDRSHVSGIAAPGTPHRRIANTPPHACGVLVYVRHGALYIQPLPTGPRRRLTFSGQCRRPRWSSSGKWLAFARDGHLWVIDRNGKQTQRLSDDWHDYAWSPVSDTLVCYRQERLCLFRPETGRQRVLAPAPPPYKDGGTKYDNLEIAWSPDGKWLAYVRHENQTNTSDGFSCIWRLRADGSDAREIYRASCGRGGDAVHPELLRWFLTGNRILFWTMVYHASSVNRGGAPLVSVARDGGEPTPFITAKLVGSPWDDGSMVLLRNDFVAFSPDGSRLAVTQGSGRDVFENKRLFSIDLASGQVQPLTEANWACSCPTWSPDSTQIAYIAVPEQVNLARRVRWRQLHLWCMDADGTHKRPLLQDRNYRDDSPHWLADGEHLLLTRYDNHEKPSLWVVGADGKQAHKIADVGDGEDWEGTERNGNEEIALWVPRAQ